MSIMTFGSAKEKNTSCDIVHIGIHTNDGSHLTVKLLSVPIICSKISATPVKICQERNSYLRSLDLVDVADDEEPHRI